LAPGLPDALIYFNKVATVKYFPYTNIPFIGTPYARSAVGDWMAIPHELGHYLYWNLGSALQDIRGTHQEIQDGAARELEAKGVPESQRLLLLPWIEETFCDIVGVRIVGAEFATHFVGFLRTCAGNMCELARNDGSHPPLCLRPFVREQALDLREGRTSGQDWNAAFREVCGKGIDDLYIRPSPEDYSKVVQGLSADELRTLLSMEDWLEVVPAGQLQQFRLDEVIPNMKVLVEYLDSQIDALLATFQPPKRGVGLWSRLLELAEQIQALPEQKLERPYEVLLHPVILEGGERHGPHDCWAHFKLHEMPAHNH
jgi:hypothetical protein